jgi:hypothetical protein
MPLDPTLAAGVQPIQTPSALSTIGSLMQLKDYQAQASLRAIQAQQAQAQTADLQAQADGRNRDLADQNTLQETEKDPATYAKIISGDLSPLAGKVQPKTIDALQAAVNTRLQSEATRTTDQLKQRGEAAKTLGDNLGTGLSTLRKPDGSLDVPAVNAALPDFIRGHAAELKVLGVDPSTLPTSVTDEDHFNLLANRLNAFGAMTTAALGLKKTQAETADSTAKAAASNAAANKDQFELDLMKGAQNGSQDAAIDQRFGKDTVGAQAAKDAFRANLPAGVKAATDAVNTIYENRIGAAQKADALRPGEVKKAVQIEAATLPMKLQESETLGEAQSGIRQGEAATKDYVASLGSVQHAQAVGATIKTLVQQAQAGDATAAGTLQRMLPELVNSVQGIKRPATGTQLGATFGSALDKLQGHISSASSGVAIPKSELAQIPGDIDTLLGAAAEAHNAHVDTLNGAYNKSFAKVPVSAAPSAAKFKVGDMVNYQGKPHKVTAVGPDGKLTLEP